jgi:DNA-binding transcriptional ArsR family regulator
MTQFSDSHMSRIVSRARALGDPTRVRILLSMGGSERAVGQVANALSMQQSTVSKHLQVLLNAGLVNRRRDANAVIYSTDAGDLDRLLRTMGQQKQRRRRINSSRDSKTNPARSRSSRTHHRTTNR